MKFGVKILPREVILDSQGRAVEKLLKNTFPHLNTVRVGKYIEIVVDENEETKGAQQVKKMAEELLHNPLIETYEIQRIS